MNTPSQDELRQRLAALDTPSIADAMDSLDLYGALLGIHSRAPAKRTVAGPAFTVAYRPFSRKSGEFHNAGNYIDRVGRGDMIVVDNEGRYDCTVWGDILTETALFKGIAGTVIYGAARDLEEVKRLSYPLFSTAIHMVSGKNRVKVTAIQAPIQIGTVTVNPGDWIVADCNGALVVPADRIADVVLRAELIDHTEQRIRSAVHNGMALEEARAHYRYDRPWEEAVSS
jgi:regulator of RNase E activity RraA